MALAHVHIHTYHVSTYVREYVKRYVCESAFITRASPHRILLRNARSFLLNRRRRLHCHIIQRALLSRVYDAVEIAADDTRGHPFGLLKVIQVPPQIAFR